MPSPTHQLETKAKKIHSMERQNSIMLKSTEGSQAAFTVTASAAYCVNLSRLLNLSMPQSPLF